jgi:thymidine kinase
MATIDVITGVMFAGKSDELLKRVRHSLFAKKRVKVFKPVIDTRHFAHEIHTHDGTAMTATPIKTAGELFGYTKDIDVIAIDEAQFLDKHLPSVCEHLAEELGIQVILAGTESDFRGEPFGPMPYLLAIADTITKLHAVCVVCGNKAIRNQRLIDKKPAPYDSPTVLVGGAETYEARCRQCFVRPK